MSCDLINFLSYAALDLDFFSIDDFTSINFEPLAELKVENESLKEKTYFRNRQALQQALTSAANLDADMEDDLHKLFWSGDANKDSRLNLSEFRKIISVDHIDMEETHVQALVASLFQVYKSDYCSWFALSSLANYLCVQFMDLNNDKHLDFNEFSKILVGSMRAEFRLR